MNDSAFDRFVQRLFAAPRADAKNVREFIAAFDQTEAPTHPIEAAAFGGAMADRLGFAFVAGYHAALRQLTFLATQKLQQPRTNTASRFRRACLAATESGGVHPKAIRTTLSKTREGALILRGTKTFATLANVAEDILVVACREPGDVANGSDRPNIVIVRIPTDREGVRSTPKSLTPFAPEIPHSEIELADVSIREDEVLPGDGYSDYLKPFRTVEDLHVLASTAGHLLSVAKRGSANGTLSARVVALLAGVRTLADESPQSAIVHIALDAMFGETRSIYDEATSALNAEYQEERDRLARDRPLLLVAEGARRKRFEIALRAVAVG